MNKSSHKSKTISGLKWTVLNQIIVQGTTFVLGVFLMRLLPPSEFGILGMIAVFSGFIAVFQDFGLGSSLIHKRNIEKKEIDTIFWSTIILGLLLTLVLFFLSPVIANFYSEPKLVIMAQVVSLTFFLQSFSLTQKSLARKEMNFSLIFKVNVLAVFISGSVALFLAIRGYGVWSLIIQQIVMQISLALAFTMASDYKPSLYWSKGILKSHLNYSLPLVGSKSLNYWTRSADNFFIGSFLGAVSLGFYVRAYSTMMVPVGQISGVFSNVLFPSMAIIQEDKSAMAQILWKGTRIMALIICPTLSLVYMFADSLVIFVFGNEWIGMINVLKILILVGIFQSVGSLKHNVFLTNGKTKLLFRINILRFFIVIPMFYFTAQISIEAAALGYLIYVFCMQFFVNYFLALELNWTYGYYFKSFLVPYLFVALLVMISNGIDTGIVYLTLDANLIKLISYSFIWLLAFTIHKSWRSEITNAIKQLL